MDVERAVAKRLMDSIGIKAVLEVPDERPDELISVELTGGNAGRFIKRLTLAVQSWAQSRRRAAEIAALVEQAVYDLADEPNIFSATPSGTYRWPDPDSGQDRYQTTVELTICE